MLRRDGLDARLPRSRPGTVERAFELAASGECSSLREIERQLQKEGCENVADHLDGMLIRAQLRRRLLEASRVEASTLQLS